MIDGRDVDIPRFRKSADVHSLCLIHQVDGLVILDHSSVADFKMEIHCGNGGAESCIAESSACAVAYADLLGVKPFHSQEYSFELDGMVHNAFISSHLGECKEVGIDGDAPVPVLCLGMMD